MDGVPVQIVQIIKEEGNKNSNYKLNSEALSEILSQVNDKKVAVISIVGKSRRGKSFLLSYLIKYLSDSTNANWIPNIDEPLLGFEWKNTIDPVTKGVWMWSKPIIVQQSVGGDLAILLMDSQGVYDENTDLRDWSTIVGITLLTSSIFIFNIFTDIQENNLTDLETFLLYGQMAIENEQTDEQSKPFQKLLFLVRDWNFAQEIKPGLSGGKKYMANKLSIKNTQSEKSKRTRKLINECFEEVSCCLMPKHVLNEEQDFNGSVSQLNPDFVKKMKELFSVFFDPESLDVKVISGLQITARDLQTYFEDYIEIFNSDKLDPSLLLEVTAKATDFKIIFDLKMKYIRDMEEKINSKKFLSKVEFMKSESEIKKEINQSFVSQIKSKNKLLVEQLRQFLDAELKAEYSSFHNKNEKRRENTANDTIEMCINFHKERIDNYFEEKVFGKTYEFDQIMAETRNLAISKFNEIFQEENAESVANYLLKILKTIGENEVSFRTENQNRKSDSKKQNKETVDKSLDFYCDRIKAMIDENVFLIDENFNKLEEQTKAEALKIFSDNCTGNETYKQKFLNSLNSQLEHKRTELASLNINQMRTTITKTELDIKTALNYYTEKMKKTLQSFCGNEDFNAINKNIKTKAFALFEGNRLLKDSNLWSQYSKKLESDINKQFVDYNVNFEEKLKNLEQFYCEAIDNAMNKNFLEENAFFNEECLLSAEEAITLREDLLNDVKQNYENLPKEENIEEIRVYINEETAKASDVILINKLIGILSEQMQEIMSTKPFHTRRNLLEIFDDKKSDTINSFDSNKKTENSEELYTKLNEEFEKTFEKFNSENEQKRETYIEEEIEKCFITYKENMSEILGQFCLEQHRFEKITDEFKTKSYEMLNKICGEENELQETYSSKLKQLMEAQEKEFEAINSTKLREANKMNTESVKKSLSFYEKRMETALKDHMIYTEEAFRKHHHAIKDETFNLFSNICKCGELEFIEKFEINLQQNIAIPKRKFKKIFSEETKKYESFIAEEISKCVEYYRGVMTTLLDFMKKEEFKMEHKKFKSKAIDSLKSKLTIKDEEFINKKIDELESKLENEFEEYFLNKFENYPEPKSSSQSSSLRDPEKSAAVLTVESIENESVDNEEYSENKEISDDNLATALNEDLISNFISVEVESRESEKPKYEKIDEPQEFAQFVIKKEEFPFENADEFEKIESSNESEDENDSSALLEIITCSSDSDNEDNEDLIDETDENQTSVLKLEIEKLVQEYQDRMSLMTDLVLTEDDLKRSHIEILNEIEDKMISLNPFSNSMKFEPFLKELNVEIEKSFEDSCRILKAKSDKKAAVLKEKITKKALKFYRDEMDKYFENTNFLLREKLEEYSSKAIERTVDKFKDERGEVSLEFYQNYLIEKLKIFEKEISEENLKNAPTLPAIGIDLGTTYSCVAYFRTGKPRGEVVVIPNELGNRTTPSVVNFLPNNEVVVGEAANESFYSNASNLIYSAKRLIGRQFNDKEVQNDMKLWPFKVIDEGNNIAKIKVEVDGNQKTFFPEQISAMILEKLKQTAEKYLGCPVKNAVITVPAYFNDSQKEATKDAGIIAGLNVLKIINEPTAAALAFQLKRNDDLETKKVLIFDFGGGTLDIVVLVIENGVIDIKAVGGDTHLGGDDIDNNIAQYCLDEFKFRTNITFNENTEEYEKALRRLKVECERKKRNLCGAHSVVINVDSFYKRKDLSIKLKREKFEELNAAIFEKSMILVEQVLEDAKLKHEEIDDIVLVGGTTRILQIRHMLLGLFPEKKLNHSVNPDEAVAIGAAIQAAILNGSLAHDKKFLKVSDVAPMSLGVEVKDGFMSVIVHRNSKVPEKYMKKYETTCDNQHEVEVKIYEGEERMAADNRLLGTFVVHNIPQGYAGEQQFVITFDINDEGILHVKAKLMNSDEEHGIRITEHKGRLSDKDLAEMMNNTSI